MKKYIGFLIVLGVLVFGVSQVSAITNLTASKAISVINTTTESQKTNNVCTSYSYQWGVCMPDGTQRVVNYTANPVGCSLGKMPPMNRNCTFIPPITSTSVSKTAIKIPITTTTTSTTQTEVLKPLFPTSTTKPITSVPVPSPLCMKGSAPWIKVISPNGGEIFTVGSSITAKWTSCNIPTNTQINLGLQWSFSTFPGVTVPTSVTINDGSSSYTLPNSSAFYSGGLQFGQFYKIVVTAPLIQIGGISVFDVSDNLFTITGQVNPIDPSITSVCNAKLLYPHPNELFNLTDNATPSGNNIVVDAFLLVHSYSSGCSWNTTGSLIPTSNPFGGSAGSIGVLQPGQTQLNSGQPMVILGNLNFGTPSVGDRIYHQQITFNPSYSSGIYNIRLEDGNSHALQVPISISF